MVSSVNNLYTLKIVSAGDGGIGKTTFLNVFNGIPYHDQEVTIGLDLHIKKVFINGTIKILQIWDLGGQIQFRFFLPDYFKGAHGILLGFDVSRFTTFQSLEEWLAAIREKCPQTPVVLVAYKADKAYYPALRREMGFEFAEKYGLIDFIEVSAKEDINVETPFRSLLTSIFDSSEPDLQIQF